MLWLHRHTVPFYLERAHTTVYKVLQPRKQKKKRPIGVHHLAIWGYIGAGECLLDLILLHWASRLTA